MDHPSGSESQDSGPFSVSERDYELEALEAARQAEEDEAHAAAVAAGIWHPVPREAKLLSSVGGAVDAPVPMVAEDLLPEGQVVLLCAEEGTGKSWAVHQAACELVSGRPVWGAFAVERPARSVLIVDVEQSQEDVRIIRDEMLRRSLLVDGAPVFWLEAADRAFDDPEDAAWLIQQVALHRPEVLILDTATDAITDPMDDKAVRRAMALYRWLVRETSVRVFVGLAQPRKQGQSADARGRSFDSLFGSRVWKSKPSAVFWMTEQRLTIWKQRGRYLERRWGREAGTRYAWGSLDRPLIGPPLFAGPPVEVDEEALAAETDGRVLKAIAENNLTSKAAVAKAAKVKASAARESVDRLVGSGRVVTGTARGTAYRVADTPTFN